MSEIHTIESAPLPPGAASGGRHRRELAAATVGSIVEAFDWSVYVVFAAFFTDDLFGSDSRSATVLAYGGFAVGFLARPVGSIVFGRISDRYGRRFNLMLCMSIIAGASLAIAVLPSAASIGGWAVAALIVLRIVQGLAYGGEGPTVAAYVAETAPRRHRFLFSAISYSGVIIGSLLVFATVAVLDATIGSDALRDGGWRWGFVAGGGLGLLALWVRRFAPESTEFEHSRAAGAPDRAAAARALTEHARALLTIFLISLGGTVSYYFALVYLPKLTSGTDTSETARNTSYMTVVLFVALVAMIVAGALADRFGVLVIMRITFAYNAIVVLPVTFALLHDSLPFEIASVALGLGAVGFMAVGNVLFALLLPIEIRALAAGLIWTLTTAAFGGTFPMLAEALQGAGLRDIIPIYVFAGTLALLAGAHTVTKVPRFAVAFGKESRVDS